MISAPPTRSIAAVTRAGEVGERSPLASGSCSAGAAGVSAAGCSAAGASAGGTSAAGVSTASWGRPRRRASRWRASAVVAVGLGLGGSRLVGGRGGLLRGCGAAAAQVGQSGEEGAAVALGGRRTAAALARRQRGLDGRQRLGIGGDSEDLRSDGRPLGVGRDGRNVSSGWIRSGGSLGSGSLSDRSLSSGSLSSGASAAGASAAGASGAGASATGASATGASATGSLSDRRLSDRRLSDRSLSDGSLGSRRIRGGSLAYGRLGCGRRRLHRSLRFRGCRDIRSLLDRGLAVDGGRGGRRRGGVSRLRDIALSRGSSPRLAVNLGRHLG